MRVLSIIMDDMSMKKLRALSKKLDRSVSWLVREAVKKYLPKKVKK